MLMIYSRFVEVLELDDVLVAVVLGLADEDDELLWVVLGVLVETILLELDEDDEGGKHCE
jgi:hypothetical protein